MNLVTLENPVILANIVEQSLNVIERGERVLAIIPDKTRDDVPRYRITMASGLDEGTCRRVNLGYLDYGLFNLASFDTDPDTLIVSNAGRDLYQVQRRLEITSSNELVQLPAT